MAHDHRPSSGEPGPIPQVDVSDAADRHSQADSSGRRPLLVDVRERNELEVVRAAGVIHVPLSEFAESSRRLPRDRELLLICASGNRSLVAAEYLQRNGYPNVANV
ncbi:MAG: rhodanese-like domain-containing protein, partial [Chloroflexota bacterium]|nr:rhodanese-like domain-containing protein [Chloroflexota bacterium]